jgi:putative drug exporter of the RND superfamily
VFWPFGIRGEKVEERELDFDQQTRRLSPMWDAVARLVLARPGVILWLTVVPAAFFISEGLHVRVTHDFMNELADQRSSKLGTAMVREFYPPGEASPTTVVAYLPDGNLDDPENFDVNVLHNYLRSIEGVADVRSLYNPSGGNRIGRGFMGEVIAGSPGARNTFVSEAEGYEGKVTQLNLVLDADPFSREARSILDGIEAELAAVARGELVPETPPEDLSRLEKRQWPAVREGLLAWKGAEFDYAGTTSGIRDLERTTEADRQTIQILVVLAVFTVILLILRRFLICLFLIVTVVLSYWATIGVTEMVFQWYYQGSYDGLDWKVPIFLFVILIAVGQDYNIYLATRVFEEQAKFGPRRGLRRAMVQTGGIITSCGVIMAGTFIAMATGTLRGMIELGFSLSFGVLLDTFFVRTILVPCFLALIANRQADPTLSSESPPADQSTHPNNLHSHTNGTHAGDETVQNPQSNAGR